MTDTSQSSGKRGKKNSGSLPELISPYLRDLIKRTGGSDGPVGRQFIFQQSELYQHHTHTSVDPQQEHTYEAAPGVVYKYRGVVNADGNVVQYGRALWTISRFCATYCRFCFRGRMVGLPASQSREEGETLARKPYLSDEDITEAINFFSRQPEINEVILSGGDPLVSPRLYFTKIVTALVDLQKKGDIQIIRTHTRAPITNPFHMKSWMYDLFEQIENPIIVLHINHPAEVTPEVITIIHELRRRGVLLFSQTVLLNGVNDSVETLQELFLTLIRYGVVPYYLHQNDPVPWATHFTVPFPRAVEIWRALRPRLSGITATVKFVIDTPGGVGKVSVPEGGWDVEYGSFCDFEGKQVST